MNKEVIKKYREAFNYWLDGGRVWISYGENSWFKSEKPEWDSQCIYVQDDEYSEFRRALADGKTIQHNPLMGRCPTWTDINMSVYSFDEGLKHYRIKPDESTFKLGDTVSVVKGGWAGATFKIKSISECGLYYLIDQCDISRWSISKQNYLKKLKPKFKEGDWVIDADNTVGMIQTMNDSTILATSSIYERPHRVFELWTPNEGEWCWKGTEFILITSISNLNREDGLLTYGCSVPCRSESFTSSFKPEPFIGTLPTKLKDS